MKSFVIKYTIYYVNYPIPDFFLSYTFCLNYYDMIYIFCFIFHIFIFCYTYDFLILILFVCFFFYHFFLFSVCDPMNVMQSRDVIERLIPCIVPVKSVEFGVFQSPDTQAWQNDYLQGTGCEMYTETLSPSFTGMTFPQASE